MLQEKDLYAKEFDLQLFSDGDDTPNVDNKGNTPEEKIKIDGKEYSSQEIKDALGSLENQKKWRKELADKGEDLNNQKRVIEAWTPVVEKYDKDDEFQKIFDKLIDERDVDFQKAVRKLAGLDTNDDDESDDNDITFQIQKVLKAQAEEIARLKETTSALIKSEERKLMSIALEDRNNVEKAIQSNEDPFTIEDVETLVEQQAITFSEAYDRMQLKNKDAYKEKIRQQTIKEIEEKYKKSAPDSSMPPGSGITGKSEKFISFEDAADRIKKQGAGKLWK